MVSQSEDDPMMMPTSGPIALFSGVLFSGALSDDNPASTVRRGSPNANPYCQLTSPFAKELMILVASIERKARGGIFSARSGKPVYRSTPLFQVAVEPSDHAFKHVALVLRVGEEVPFVVINDQFRLDVQGFECVPKFVRLRRGAFAIAIAHYYERWRLHLLDEGEGCAPSIHFGVVIDRFAEERNHPLIDLIFAVVALPIGDAGSGHRGLEAIGLRDAPHGHVTAVAPASKTEAVFINGRGFDGGVHASHDVAEIAVAEILHVGTGEGFALAVAAARIGLEHEVAGAGKRRGKAVHRGPIGHGRIARAAVYLHHQGVFLPGVEVAWINQPALHFVAVALPGEALHRAPSGLQLVILMRDLLPGTNAARPNFGGGAHGLSNDPDGFAVIGHGNRRAPASGLQAFVALPDWLH